jgi:ubiquitin C-terminal hydrolase
MNSTKNSVVVAVVESMTTTTTTCDACGYAAAIIAAICLGTLGVPIKSEVVSRLDVDALVMQVRSGGRFVHVMSRTYLFIYYL